MKTTKTIKQLGVAVILISLLILLLATACKPDIVLTVEETGATYIYNDVSHLVLLMKTPSFSIYTFTDYYIDDEDVVCYFLYHNSLGTASISCLTKETQ